MSDIRNAVMAGNTVLGIEFGSTRIKAVLVDEDNHPIAQGGHEWENQYVDNIWSYSLEDIWKGLQNCYREMAEDVKKKYGVALKKIGAIGFSGMMHGYMAFDQAGELLVPFRTWRNNITGEASEKLSQLFNFQIPQRWSIAHLYQAILNREEHVKNVAFITTLAGYIHWMLTGEKVIGIGEGSGMFPIDAEKKEFCSKMLNQFDELTAPEKYAWKIRDILPKVLVAGDHAGRLTEEGSRLLDPTGELEPGIPFCPPEGDAGTGMAATNSVRRRTGNVSAGTSVFAMLVLEKELTRRYPEIDMVTTPAGDSVAMVHSNNCTSDLNAWVGLFEEFASAIGADIDKNKLFSTLYNKALEGDTDCGGLLAYGYLSGEHITHFEEGRPMFVRTPQSRFSLANFMRVNLYTALGALKTGLDILSEKEGVEVDKILGHGGLFKTPGVGQKILAAAMNTPVSVMETAGEGGAWGIALLASYMLHKAEGESLADYLDHHVFMDSTAVCVKPDPEDVKGFEEFMKRYHEGLAIERAAVEYLQ